MTMASGGASGYGQGPSTKNTSAVQPSGSPDSEFYDKKDKKGYVLILNSTSNREGTEHDVRNLKAFFKDVLHYEVHDPRSEYKSDMTTEQLNKCLSDVKNMLNGHIGTWYFCFICVILSHGNENGIKTRNGSKTREEIRQEFINTQVPNFTGRPKVFLFQSCYGSDVQDSVIMPESLGFGKPVRVPVDADTLLAFPTTPGYVAVRDTESGSWFIQECMNVFQRNYRHDHLEEMLITVRRNVAVNYPEDDDELKQMPFVWTTLTKRLML